MMNLINRLETVGSVPRTDPILGMFGEHALQARPIGR